MSITQKKSSPALRLRERLRSTICRTEGKKVSGTLWPNGEFSFAYVPDDVTQVTRGEECSWAMPGPGESDEGASALDLTMLDNLLGGNTPPHQTPAQHRYGLRGMTPQARKKVRSSAFLLQERYGKERLSFLTLTVPPLGGVASERRLAARWHDAVRYLLRRLKTLLSLRKCPPYVVGVSEIQVARYVRSGQFPMHLHIVFVGRKRKRGAWAVHYSEFRQAWGEILQGIVGHPIETRYLENVKEVEKDAGNYLGKYMSKSQNEIEKVMEDGNEWMLPKQWWFSSKEMKDWLKSQTCRGEKCGLLLESVVHEVWDSPREYPDLWLRKIEIDLDGFKYVAGYIGKIPKEWVKDLQGLLMLPL